MPEEKITATEARQATVRPRAMVLVLFASLFLCLMAGLGLSLSGWFSLPRCLSNEGPHWPKRVKFSHRIGFPG